MASPFKFFRKYSGGMMIVMVILSMLLFTLTDLFSDPSANLWLLGLLLGGAVFGIAGAGQGRWLQWGFGGAILGTVLGYVLPNMVDTGGLDTALGRIDEQEMQDLGLRRAIANQVVFRATEATFGEGTGRFATLFGFGHTQNNEDVIFGKLMRAEADRLGISVDETMIGDYLKKITDSKLTAEDYVAIRNTLSYKNQPVNDDTLNGILGDEIKARMAYQMLRPRTTSLPPGPEVYWQYYRRLNVRQQINTAALDVDEFLSEVGEPSESEINELFAQNSKRFPGQEAAGAPGFRLPFRAQLAYVELDSASIEEEIGDISDEDIAQYYADNKETPLIRTPVVPDLEQETEEPESKEGDTAENKESKEEPKPEEPKSEDPKPTEEPKPDDKPAPEEAKAEPAEKTEPKEEPAPAEEKEGTEGDSEESCGDEEEEAGNEKPVDDEATPPASEEKSPEQEGSPKPETQDPDAAVKTAPSLSIPSIPAAAAEEGSDAAAPEIQYEYRELDDELKAEIREELLRRRVDEEIDKKMEAVMAQMESLSRERSRERFSLIEKDAGKFEGDPEQQQESLRQLRESMKDTTAGIGEELKTFANSLNLAYVETPLLSYADLLDSETYPVGSAVEPNDNPMMAAQSPNVAITVFQGFSNDEQNNDAQSFKAGRAVLRGAALDDHASHYAYWATDFSVSHVPTLDEPGVRESVVKEWKRIKAREAVIARGEELVQKVRDGLSKEGDAKVDMATTLSGETMTGVEGALAMTVQKTLPFSWLRTSTASPMNFRQQQASLSPIMFEGDAGGQLERVGESFMDAVFADMKNEDVRVVPDTDLLHYHIVHVTNRFPTPEVGEDGLRERFATEGEQFAFAQSPILNVMHQQLGQPANTAWERSVWLTYGVDPDGEPEE